MKSSIKKSAIKYLFVARGPGETGQAAALAKFIADRGGNILFCLLQEKNKFFLKGEKRFKIFLTENKEKLAKIVEKEKPEILLLFNSKIWGKEFSESPCFPKPLISIGLDSNWLFNNKAYPYYSYTKWADIFFVFFPKKIFQLGLKNFNIEKQELKKIIPVGFIPSYKKPRLSDIKKKRKELNLQKNEKLIFSYFSGFGAGHRIWAFYNLVKAVDRMKKKGKKLKVLYIGPTEDIKIKRQWLVLKNKMSTEEYFLTLAASDLVFQHQGMVTLAQAISCQIPVITNVSLLKNKALPKIHFFEVEPFAKTKTCLMFSKSSPIKKISKGIEDLLFNKKAIETMKKNQKAILRNGEKQALKIIKKLLKQYEKTSHWSNIPS